MITRPKILVVPGAVKEIAKRFNCTTQMVNKALNLYSYSELADNIRKVAIKEYGGKKMEIPALV